MRPFGGWMAGSERTSEVRDQMSELVRVADVHEFARAARADGKLVVWVPRSVRSKETLLLLLSKALQIGRAHV